MMNMNIFSETITKFKAPNNGSGPLWCYGSPTIIRNGNDLYATVMEVDGEAVPLNNTVLTLYHKRKNAPWKRVFRDDFLQREPCPIAMIPGNLIVSTNPSLRPKKTSGEREAAMSSRPVLYFFDFDTDKTDDAPRYVKSVIPGWDNPDYGFSSHTYRALAADADSGEILLMSQCLMPGGNWDWRHCWSVLDKNGVYVNGGIAEYPVRSCYQSAAVKNGTAHAFAVSDIIEPNEEWRLYKKERTGNEWDYDFRILYYSYAGDIRRGNFGAPVVIASADETCGHARPADIYVDDSGDAHLIYSIRNVWHTFMRDKFFPSLQLSASFGYCRMRDGDIVEQYNIDEAQETKENEGSVGSFSGFFHVSADKRLRVFYHRDNVCDNRGNGWHVTEITASGASNAVNIPDLGFTNCFNVKPRMGTDPSDFVDIYGVSGDEIKYARITLE